MNTLVWVLLLMLMGLLTWLLIRRGINVASFTAVTTVWIFVALIYFIEPRTIAEIVIGKLAIKRDVQAAREIRGQVEKIAGEVQTARQEVKQTAADLREVVEAVVEMNYLAVRTRNKFPMPNPAAGRFERDLNVLAEFANPVESNRRQWLNEMNEILKSSGVQV